MFLKKIYIILSLSVLSNLVLGQLQNGSFEEWTISNTGDELPQYWDAVTENADTCVSKSTIAADGLYSLQLSSLNIVSGTYAPAYIGTKFKPTYLQYRFQFQYLIDSIAGQSHAVVGIYQINVGNYELVFSEKYNQVSEDFIDVSVDITLPDLDTLIIGLIAENHALPIGHDGFISVVFDNLVIEYTSSDISATNLDCNDLMLMPVNGAVEMNNICTDYDYYQLFSITGKLIDSGKIESFINIPETGIAVLQLYNSIGQNKVVKVLGL